MRISDTRFVVLDTETTGLDPACDKVVDISLVEVSRNGIRPLFDTLVNPQRDIPPTASAVHHITQKHIEGKPTFEEIWPTILHHLEGTVIVAHNAQFDRSMIPEVSQPWICSLRLARHLWPEAPGHSNQVLRYWLGLDIDAQAAHSAAGDTLVTANVLYQELIYFRRHVAKTDQVEDLIEYASSAIPIEMMPFGKHKGSRLIDLPLDYLSWALHNLNDLDSDLRISLEQIAATRS